VVWVEAGVPIAWRALARPRDAVVGIDRFGASGPGLKVAHHLGLSPGDVAGTVLRTLGRRASASDDGADHSCRAARSRR
jgi:transketolase